MTEVDYLLYTDGSGYTDKIGGWCFYLKDLEPIDKKNDVFDAMGGTTFTSVYRMEFTALLEGLRQIQFLNEAKGLKDATVEWFSDNSSLVDVIAKEGHSKSKDIKDLWKLYKYYVTQGIEVKGNYISRDNVNIYHNLADLHASTVRVILKEYKESQ